MDKISKREWILHLLGRKLFRRQSSRVPLGLALSFAQELQKYLESLPEVLNVSLAGSARRWKESVGDIDLVVATREPNKVAEKFVKHPRLSHVLEQATDRILVCSRLGIKVELIQVPPEEFYLTVFRDTGSKAHWLHLEQVLAERGITPELVQGNSVEEFEKGVYAALGLAYIPPELREDQGEIEAAVQGKLPQLLELGDIKGDLHVHTNWSDGIHTLPQMADAARARGYEYIAITDHSKSLRITHGLSEKRILEQRKLIDQYNREHPDFRVLAGIEVDILSSSALDYPDDFLKDMDIVIASVHTGFKQDQKRLTERILTAIKNEHVDIIAHPTGRLLGRRDPYPLDLEEVLEVAATTQTAVEINASPDRLDLNDANSRRLAERGGLLAINTDAHDCRHLADMEFGVMTARRGWVEKNSVINSWPLKKLQRWLDKG
jgi:DNA polymerase (family 10)